MTDENQCLKTILSEKVTQVSLAKACEVSQQAVGQWYAKNRVPAKRVKSVSDITGIHPSVLNPDVFPAENHPVGEINV